MPEIFRRQADSLCRSWISYNGRLSTEQNSWLGSRITTDWLWTICGKKGYRYTCESSFVSTAPVATVQKQRKTSPMERRRAGTMIRNHFHEKFEQSYKVRDDFIDLSVVFDCCRDLKSKLVKIISCIKAERDILHRSCNKLMQWCNWWYWVFVRYDIYR